MGQFANCSILRRFPLPILASLLLTLSNILIPNQFENELINCFILYLAFSFLFENHDLHWVLKCIISAIVMLPLIYLYNNPSGNDIFMLGSLLFLSSAPFLYNNLSNKDFCAHNLLLFYSFVYSWLLAILLVLFVVLANTASEVLLSISLSGKYVDDVIAVIMYLILPNVFLVRISKSVIEPDYTKFARFMLVKFIVPFLLVSFLILYLYIFKFIFIHQQVVSYSSNYTLGIGSLGILVHIFSYPIRNDSTMLFKFFYRYFYWLLILPIFIILEQIDKFNLLKLLVLAWLVFSIVYNVFLKEIKLKDIALCLSILFLCYPFVK